MTEELLDLVNEHDEVIGCMERSEVYRQKLTNFRAVNAFIKNDKGELWIPRRTKHKSIFPLCLDASMGGCVSSGETYAQAFAREMMEELRIDVSKTPYQDLGMVRPHEHGTSAFSHIYLLHSNEAPDYNPEDYVEFFWLTPQQLLDWIAAGQGCKGDLPKFIHHFFMS